MENKNNDLQEKKDQIMSEVETYAKAEYELARLQVIENTSRVVGTLLITICIILVVFAVISFCASAAVFAMSQHIHMWAACLIVAGIYVLLIPILILSGKALFIDTIVKKMSGYKNVEELKYETLRAEGRAAVQRERMSGHVRFAQTMYNHYANLLQTAWNTIRSMFTK